MRLRKYAHACVRRESEDGVLVSNLARGPFQPLPPGAEISVR